MTLEEVAEAAGITASAVARIESGARAPMFETVIRLEKGLDLPAGFFSSIVYQNSKNNKAG